MVNPEVLRLRLTKLREYHGILGGLKKFSRSRFKEDPLIHGSVERYLQLSAEAMIDIAGHIVADQNLGSPQDYRETFRLLGAHKIISKPLSKKLQDWAGFRNILVHDYIRLDLDRVYDKLHNDIHDIERFAKRFASFL